MASTLIFKICPEQEWTRAEQSGLFKGSAVDLEDGFIHFSAADQVAETAAKYFSGHAGLVLVAVDAATLGDGLKWEPSRGGALFPHLYGPLPAAAAVWVRPLPLGPDGAPQIPALS